jgi:hypothetical protein
LFSAITTSITSSGDDASPHPTVSYGSNREKTMIDKPTFDLPFYEIQIKGHLDAQWSDWFEGLTITLEENGDTLLSGPVADQPALYGILRRVRDLGMPLVSVIQINRFETGERMNISTTPIRKIEANNLQPSFWSILYQTIISHTVTYFTTGIVASILFGYATRMIRPDVAPIIRKITDPILMAGPLFQPFRAALLAIVFYLLRDVLFSNRKGWLIMWCMLVVIGILTPFSASWGGIEGMIFFNLPIWDHIVGWPEVFVQTLLLSVILTYWVDHPKSKRLHTILLTGFILTMLLPIIALLTA